MENQKIVVNAPEGNELSIFTGEKKIHYFSGTKYKIDTIDSIAGLVKFRGTPEKTLIFCNDERIGIIFDDSIMDRPQDIATFGFEMSDEFGEWKSKLNDSLSQKRFVDFLKLRKPAEVTGLDDLLGKAQYLSYATSIVGDFNYEDRDNITVAIKIKDSESTAKIPQLFVINVPLVFGSDKVLAMEIQLDLIKPRDETQKPSFCLTCPKFDRYWAEAVEYEIDRLKKLLPDFQIISGSIS